MSRWGTTELILPFVWLAVIALWAAIAVVVLRFALRPINERLDRIIAKLDASRRQV